MQNTEAISEAHIEAAELENARLQVKVARDRSGRHSPGTVKDYKPIIESFHDWLENVWLKDPKRTKYITLAALEAFATYRWDKFVAKHDKPMSWPYWGNIFSAVKEVYRQQCADVDEAKIIAKTDKEKEYWLGIRGILADPMDRTNFRSELYRRLYGSTPPEARSTLERMKNIKRTRATPEHLEGIRRGILSVCFAS